MVELLIKNITGLASNGGLQEEKIESFIGNTKQKQRDMKKGYINAQKMIKNK